MNNLNKIYDKICKTLKSKALFNSCLQLLEWDQETNMPENGIKIKSEQNKLLSEIIHKTTTTKKYASQLNQLIDIDNGTLKANNLSEEEKKSIREIRRDYVHENKLTTSFVKKFSETTTHSLQAWKEAKKIDNFKIFQPHLQKIVDLNRKKADLLGYNSHPYDALIDLYEPEVTTLQLNEIFLDLKTNLIPLIKKIKIKQQNENDSVLKGVFPIDKQIQLSTQLISNIGLSVKNYNLSQAAHPFCVGISPKDIRITTHYHEDNAIKSFLSTLHECGHGLYEHNLPEQHFGTPLSQAASYGIHESQSRIWETCIGHSREFWEYYFPKFQDIFKSSLEHVTTEQFYRAVNFVKSSTIRIFADEVTYNLHIILRYEIEKGLIDGSIQVKNIPDIWRAKMSDYLDIIPKNNKEGCLQDIHWSLGCIGYFPSYTLGNLFAGSLYENLIKTHMNYNIRISKGDFSFINIFLKEKVHKFGRQYLPIELIEKATNTTFSSKPYLSYLKSKYIP